MIYGVVPLDWTTGLTFDHRTRPRTYTHFAHVKAASKLHIGHYTVSPVPRISDLSTACTQVLSIR